MNRKSTKWPNGFDRKVYMKEWHAAPKNKADQEKVRKERQIRNRKIIDQAKNKPCMDCGKSFPSCCMDFDHRDKTTKLRAVAKLLSASLSYLLREIAKCDVVCANCHRIRTHKKEL